MQVRGLAITNAYFIRSTEAGHHLKGQKLTVSSVVFPEVHGQGNQLEVWQEGHHQTLGDPIIISEKTFLSSFNKLISLNTDHTNL
jgi:hypothetical protein